MREGPVRSPDMADTPRKLEQYIAKIRLYFRGKTYPVVLWDHYRMILREELEDYDKFNHKENRSEDDQRSVLNQSNRNPN